MSCLLECVQGLYRVSNIQFHRLRLHRDVDIILKERFQVDRDASNEYLKKKKKQVDRDSIPLSDDTIPVKQRILNVSRPIVSASYFFFFFFLHIHYSYAATT